MKYVPMLAALLSCVTAIAGCSCDDNTSTENVDPVMGITGPSPAVTTIPGGLAIDFGDVLVGQNKQVQLQIKNTGAYRLEISAVTADTGTNTEFTYSLPGKLPVKLEPTGQTVMSFVFAPTVPGAATGAVTLATNDPKAKTFKITLAGRGVQNDIEVCTPEVKKCNDDNKTQLALDFGSVHMGESAGPHTVTIRNKGDYPLTVTDGVVLSCPWDKPDCAFADMAVPTVQEFTLAPAAIAGTYAKDLGVDIAITYRPAQGGMAKSALKITSDDADEVEVWVILTGTGIAPRICPTPPLTIDFGSVTIGSSATKEFVFTSCGTEPLEVDGLAFEAGITPEFSWAEQPPPTPFTLQPKEGVTLKVKYAPTNEGEDNGRIEISSNDPAAPHGYVLLHGKGTKAPSCDMVVSPTALNFGSVPTTGFSNKVIDVQNVGDADCTFTEVRGPTGSTAFTIPTPPSLPATIPPKGIVSFAVQYKPPKVGSDTGSLIVVSPTDPTKPEQTVTLNGKGVQAPPCSLQADPAVLSFGAVPMATTKTMKTKIYNFGSEDCDISGWSLVAGSDPSFKPAKAPFPYPTLSPGKYIEASVSLVPDKAGPLNGRLEVRGGTNPILPSEKVYVTLNGSGLAAQMCVNPVLLDYGAVTLGNTKDLSFDISSCGSGTLSVRSIAFNPGNPVFTFTAAPGAPLTLASGQKKTVTVKFKPTDNTPQFGRVLVSASDPSNPTQYVELRGNYTGSCPSILVCTPSKLTFGKVEFGKNQALSFTCVNHGTDDLTINSIGLSAGTSSEYRVSAPATPLVLKPYAQIKVEVGYTPVAPPGADTGSVEINSTFKSSDCNVFQKLDIALDGEGIVPNFPKCITPRPFNPLLKWAWPNGSISNPTFNHVFMTPIVINLTDDNGDGRIDDKDTPDIVFNAYEGAPLGVDIPSMIRAISGKDGHELWQIADPKFRTNFETQLAAGDINGDNLPEIIASKLVVSPAGQDGMSGKFITGNLMAFTHDGQFLWESEPWHGQQTDMEDGSAIGIADINHDGKPLIWRGSSVFDNTGHLLWEGTGGRGSTGHGVFAFAADLDGTGPMELVAGNTAYKADGTVFWKAAVNDGISAPADFNGDGKPEVIIFPLPGVPTIVNGQTGAIISQMPKSSIINAIIVPTIADLDGDGVPEVGVIGTCQDSGSQDMQECFWGIAVDKNTMAMTEIWKEIINDATLGGGATSFDFEGDGVWEMLQNDEQWVNIYRGKQHEMIYHAPRQSVTGWELPIVVDVDNDGHAEIIIKQDAVAQGILVYGNDANDWVATKRVWNQFDYHITNVNENGTIPIFEVPNWTVYNNYLANQPFCAH